MADMQDYDLSSPSDRQEFQRFIIELIRNEINSYTKQSNNKNSAYIDPATLTDCATVSTVRIYCFERGLISMADTTYYDLPYPASTDKVSLGYQKYAGSCRAD
jgi:hypothetical protein